MKKYALLFLLFCATLAFGTLVYQAAYQQTVTASVKEAASSEKGNETLVKEDAFSEATKEMAKESGKSAIRFLFSLIYK